MRNISIKDLYLFVVILYSGMAIPFFRNQEGLILLWLLGLFIFFRPSKSISKNLLIALGVWTTYFIINTIIIKSFHPFFYGTYVAKIMIAYWLISYHKTYIFIKFENIIFKLTVLSLIIYSIQLIAPVFVYQLMKLISLSDDLFSNIPYASNGLYTFHQRSLAETFPRNSGFTWEPGPFASYIGLAIFFNIIRNGNTFKDKKRLLIFLIVLITTQSTTGFILLFAILLWYAWAHYKNKILRFVTIPITIIGVILLFLNVPFLQQKILLDSKQNIEEVMSHAEVTGKSYNPGRFASLQLRWEDLKRYPIAGFGGNSSLQYGYIGEENVVSAVSGLGNIIGRYGLIGSIIVLILILRAGKLISNIFIYKGWFIFPSLIFIIGYSFGIIETPIIVTFWLIPVFLKKNKILKSKSYENPISN
jgi:hypothetical protein